MHGISPEIGLRPRTVLIVVMKGKVVVMKPWHSKDNNVTDKH